MMNIDEGSSYLMDVFLHCTRLLSYCIVEYAIATQ